jgi:HSP20 family molecular chaperone IbpA
MGKKPATGDIIKDDIIDDFFGDIFGNNKEPPVILVSTDVNVEAGASTSLKPGYRSVLSADGMVLSIDLPGISPRDVTLWVTNTQVIVKGLTSWKSGSFTHRYTISADFDLKKVTATMTDGQLLVKIGKLPLENLRRVFIEYATH